jgi:periplasmic protein CpxP/Spy
MRAPLLILVGLVAGLIGGIAGAVIMTPSSDAVVNAGPPSDRMARLDDLEAELSRLREQVRQWELAPPMAMAPGSATIPGETEATAPAASAASGLPIQEAELKEKILDVVAEREESEREARSRMRTEMEAQHTADTLKRLTEELQLDAYQAEQLAAILAARREAMGKFREKMFAGMQDANQVDRQALRDEMQKVRAESDQQVKDLLSPDQYTKYEEISSQSRGPGRGRGGGFGR